MEYEKQFQQMPGKRFTSDHIGQTLPQGVDPVEDGGVV